VKVESDAAPIVGRDGVTYGYVNGTTGVRNVE